MTFASDYPEQRYLLPRTKVRREVLLPEGVNGTVLIDDKQRVESNTVIARGYPPAAHHLILAADILRLGRRQTLDEFLLVQPGDQVEEDQALASRRKDPERGRRAYSPVDGVVAAIDNGRIVIRETTAEMELFAGVAGLVVELIPGRGAIVESTGAMIQGVWGNGMRAVGAFKMEPEEGLESIKGGAINLDWRGSVVVTKKPLTATGIKTLSEQDISGVIAPSLDSTLMERALGVTCAILLTEGFGDANMSNAVTSMLESLMREFNNLRVTVDAVVPTRTSPRRPEAMVNVPIPEAQEPRRLRPATQLKTGARVRVSRAPYAGQTAVVRELDAVRMAVGNGLRVPAAVVNLSSGEQIAVPLTDLELFEV